MHPALARGGAQQRQGVWPIVTLVIGSRMGRPEAEGHLEVQAEEGVAREHAVAARG